MIVGDSALAKTNRSSLKGGFASKKVYPQPIRKGGNFNSLKYMFLIVLFCFVFGAKYRRCTEKILWASVGLIPPSTHASSIYFPRIPPSYSLGAFYSLATYLSAGGGRLS